MPTYKFIDLFAGLGGFHLALEQLGCKCVFASELQQDLRTLYESNFGMKCAGDINLINIEKDIPSMGHRTKRFFQWSGKMGERL